MVVPSKLHTVIGIAATGIVFTALLSVFFENNAREQSRLLLEQSHSTTLKLLDRDIDDMRRQLVQIFGDAYSQNFASLTFQKNAYGTLGVRGSFPSNVWTPIANAGRSAFRASLPERFSSSAQVYDTQYHLLDSNRAPVAKDALPTLTNSVEGTNLILRSKPAPYGSRSYLLLILILGSVFWTEVAVIVAQLLEPEPVPRPQIASVKITPPAAQPNFSAMTMSSGVFFNYLNHRLDRDFDPGAALAVIRITLLNNEDLPELAIVLNQQIAAHGFFAQTLSRSNELLLAFEAKSTDRLRILMRKMTTVCNMRSLKLADLELSGAVFYARMQNDERLALVASVGNSRTFSLLSANYLPAARPSFLRFAAGMDYNIQAMNYEQASALHQFDNLNFGANPMFLPSAPPALKREFAAEAKTQPASSALARTSSDGPARTSSREFSAKV